MTIRRLLNLVRFYFIERRYKNLPINTPSRLYCAELLSLINAASFATYTPSTWACCKISLLYPHVDVFIERLRAFNTLIARGDCIQNNLISDYKIEVDMDTFLTSKAGFYLDPENEISKLKEQALNLCSLLEDSDTEKLGAPAHNLRILNPVFDDIRNVTLALIKRKQ